MGQLDAGPSSQQSRRELLTSLLRERAAQANSFQPLSYGQKALWFLYQNAQQSAAYNTAFTARITSTLDERALRASFQDLVLRHPSLRSTFSLRDGDVVQEIHAYQAVSFRREDLSSATTEELNQAVIEDYRRPFDLEQGPVMRVTLFAQSPQDHVLLVAVHHIVCDAWSLWVMADELNVLYSAALAGRRAELPRPARDHAEFVRWQTELLNSATGAHLRDYWRNQLPDGVPVLMLPTDRPRPPIRTWRGDSHFFELEQGLIADLRMVSEAQGATMYALLLAAFQVLLHHYSLQEEFTFGSLTAGRTRPEFAHVIGYFVNPVVLRADLRGNPPFSAFLSKVRESVLEALEHQDYPFSLLVEQLRPAHDPSRTPLMDVLFVYQKRQSSAVASDGSPDSPSQPSDWGAAFELAPFEIPQMEGQFDLTLEITDGGKSVLKYDPSLFDKETIVRLAGHFQVLLKGIAANPAQRISDLPLLTAEEWVQATRVWNSTESDYPLEQCLHTQIEAQVERTPDNIAVLCEGHHLRYRSLNNHANALARRLQDVGVGPDKVIGVFMERSVEMIVALLGILKAGGAYLPLDPSYPEERLAVMAREASLQMVLTQTNSRTVWPEGLNGCDRLELDLAALSQTTEPNPESSVLPDNLAYVIYTSGSSGTPKGAMNTHRAICNRLIWMQQEYRLTPADRVLQKTPFSFDVSVWEFFWPLMNGAAIVVARPGGHRDSAYMVQTIRTEGVTVLHFVPSMLQVFLEDPQLQTCRSIKQIFCSGEALPVELQERCQAELTAELHNLYGPTEAAVDVTYWNCAQNSPRGTIPIGRPISNTQIFILNRHRTPVPVGVSGELHIGGINLARGYLNRPDLTAERFIPNPFSDGAGDRLYRTGDLARFLPDGTIEYAGRMDQQVKVRGFRIELPDIESALLKHDNVQAAAVVVRDPHSDVTLAGYFIAIHAPAPTTTELRQFLLDRVPEYMVPQVFVELDVFPLTTSGKIDRQRLPAPQPVRPTLDSGYAEPATDAETVIAEVWQKVLRVEKVGTRDNFFELGGTSLRMTQVLALIEERTGRRVSMVEAFQYPTVYALAQHLAGTVEPPDQPGAQRAKMRMGRERQIEELRTARQKHRSGEA